MPLIPCHECRAQVSDHAQTCPQCGAPVIATIKRRQKAALNDLCVRLVFVAIILIVSLVTFHHFMKKVMAPLKAVEQQQLQQQQKGATSPSMVVNFQTTPVQPPPVQPPPEPAWFRQIKLGGISGTPDHRFALINNETFAKGDQATVKVGDKHVMVHCIDIRESSVVVSIDGIEGARELKLSEN